MTLLNPNADHILVPRGVLCIDCENFAPAELERCIACGSSAVALIEEGWQGGHPDPGWPHHVEIACDGSGMVGYTRLTPAEVTEQVAMVRRHQEDERVRLEEHARELAILRERAKEDPVFAILLKRMTGRVED